MWGIRHGADRGPFPGRFIPTRVGNTQRAPPRGPLPPVHPHACGEYTRMGPLMKASGGSSPRVWGILRVAQAAELRSRFIPTRVGNTQTSPGMMTTRSVHPHACGEYTTRGNKWPLSIGSSPRVWGIPEAIPPMALPIRFIPTRVGNTLQEDARNNSLLAELQRATEPCVLQACSEDDKKGKELCKAAPSPRKTLPGRAVSLS